MRVLIDIESNRVIWFSEDDETLICTERTALINYTDPLPVGITRQNCWNWVLRERKIVPVEIPQPEKLVEINRRQAEKLLYRKIAEKRQQIAPDLPFGEMIQARKVADAQEYLNTGTSSGLLARLASLWSVSFDQAARRVVHDWTAKERMLFQTEAQLVEYLHRLGTALGSDEILALHAEIAKL